jgi:hypothetical protein
MNHDQTKQFFEAQLFCMATLDAVRNQPNLSPAGLSAAENAMFVVATSIDKVVADHPDFEKEADQILKSFFIENQDESKKE